MTTRAKHAVALATAVLIGVLAAAPTQAGLVPEAKASIAPRSEVQSIGDGEVYIFTAPPREDVRAGRRLSGPGRTARGESSAADVRYSLR